MERKKYRRKSTHKKKIKSQKQLNKSVWRAYKGLRKDKAKREGIVYSFCSDGVPVWMKRMCNKRHRRWEKRCVRLNKLDELGVRSFKKKDIFDPWLWF